MKIAFAWDNGGMVRGSEKTKGTRRLTREESGLRYDMSQFSSMKDVLEQLFGNPTYMRLKETASLSDWKKSTSQLLRAIELSIKATVTVADDDWRDAIADEIQLGLKLLQSVQHMDDLFCVLSATLTTIVFTQIGAMPKYRFTRKTVPLTERFWILNRYRTVQYVQTATQKEASTQQRETRQKQSDELRQKYPPIALPRHTK